MSAYAVVLIGIFAAFDILKADCIIAAALMLTPISALTNLAPRSSVHAISLIA